MQDNIFVVIAIVIVAVACVLGWWMENGPVKKDKDNHMVSDHEGDMDGNEYKEDKNDVCNFLDK